MSERNKPDVPNWSMGIDVARHVPGYRAVRRAFMGHDPPYYRRVNKIVDLYGEAAELPEAEPDPRANLLRAVFRRMLNKTVVVGADNTQLVEIMDQVDGKLAAAFTYNGVTRAGNLWHGFADLGYLEATKLSTVRMKEGPNTFGVGIGLHLSDSRTLVVPKLEIVRAHLPVTENIDVSKFGEIA
jgi:hypothetical protein